MNRIRLYYIGPEESDAVTGEKYSKVHHRFEFGYGKTLLIEEDRLRYNGGKFKQSQFVLFHGDIITEVTFFIDDIEDASAAEHDDSMEELPCNIGVNEVNIQYSEGRALFIQRDTFRLVHLLHLIAEGENIRIESIEGFDEERLQRKPRSYQNLQARLSSKNRAGLLNRLKRKRQYPEKKPIGITILARLDARDFRDSLGRRISFEHVRFSFKPNYDISPLNDKGESVFMKAGNIFPMKNDMALQIEPPPGLESDDIGLDLKNLLITRRNFSAREDRLQAFLENGGPKAISDSKLLVRISRQKKPHGMKIVTSMTTHMPSRKIRALTSEIGAGEGFLFATILNASPNSLKIELKPGVFVTLNREQLESCPENLAEGAIVRIEKFTGNRFIIGRAVYGDARYTMAGVRPAVALPKNELLHERVWDENDVGHINFWRNNRCFTIGGLPNITASPGKYDPSRSTWAPPNAGDFIKLMETQHPKIVLMGKDHIGHFRISPSIENIHAGKLEIDERTNGVRYIPLMKNDLTGPLALDWSQLSFGDESTKKIIARSSREKWRYHDTMTGRWKQDEIKNTEIGFHSVLDGPLFFEKKFNTLRLRYSEDKFLIFGYPVDELLRSLMNRKRTTYPIAGVSDKGGLWIELAPGRITELTGKLLVWNPKGRNQSLSHIDWNKFSPGDQIELEIVSGDRQTPAAVALKNLTPGSRGALGRHRCFLPVGKINHEEGSMELGAGEYILTLPMTSHGNSHLVMLDSNNCVQKINASYIPKNGDVVLLGLDNSKRPSVLGFPNLTPRPEANKRDVWEKDIFSKDILTMNEWGKYEFNRKHLIAFLKAVGGAVPFTVNHTSIQGNIFLSRERQLDASFLHQGALSIGRVMGLMPDKTTALLRCGPGIIKLKMDKIISGLPMNLYRKAMEVLKHSRTVIWLRGGKDGKIETGMRGEIRSEPFVETIETVIMDSDYGAKAGLICRSIESEMLYWLLAERTSWINLDSRQLSTFFKPEYRKTYKVRLVKKEKKSAMASIIDVKEIANEFASLLIGSEMIVKVIESCRKSAEGALRYIVESFTSRVILECEVHEEITIKPDDLISVEVIRRIIGIPNLLTVVPVGRKHLVMDIPSWSNENLPPFTYFTNNPQYRLDLESEDTDLSVADNTNNLKACDDKQLCRCLLSLQKSFLDKDVNFQRGIRMAEEWCQRNYSKNEVDLLQALMAIIILQKSGNKKDQDIAKLLAIGVKDSRFLAIGWKRRALDLTRNLGRRALRSLHVEILIEKWLKNENNRNRSDDLWQRLGKIEKDLKFPVKIENINDIRQFCNAVSLRNPKDLPAISDALLASMGELSELSRLYNEADVIRSLITVYRTLPVTSFSARLGLHKYHERELENIRKKIMVNQLYITLLDPLPELSINHK